MVKLESLELAKKLADYYHWTDPHKRSQFVKDMRKSIDQLQRPLNERNRKS